MSLIYQFTADDIKEILIFCRDYHLNLTKQSFGRTSSGPRGFGGELDAFGPGKLIELGVARLLSKDPDLICKIDNQIYSNYDVGLKTIPDIVEVKTNTGNSRKPKKYIEVKNLGESDQWLGIKSDQLSSILRTQNFAETDLYLIFATIFFDDNKNHKEQDFVGAFLAKFINESNLNFQSFSSLDNLKCEINYILAVSDLKKYGHEFLQGEIIPQIEIESKPKVINQDGSLKKNHKILRKINKQDRIKATCLDTTINRFENFDIFGDAELIVKTQSVRQYLNCLSKVQLKSEFFGTLDFKAGDIISFNIRNMLKARGNGFKNKSDWWIYRDRLDAIRNSGKIPSLFESFIELQASI